MPSRIRWPQLGLAKPLSSASPELTLRALILGLLIGCLLCFTNLYFGLQTGWISMMSLQSALIGFLVSRLFETPLTPQENVLVQATAAATGTMPLTAGFVGIIPALGLLDEKRDGAPPLQLTWIAAAAWSCAVAYFGVFMSPPVRKQVIIEEQLAFPSGTATAQLISVLHKMPPLEPLRKRKGYTVLENDAVEESELAQDSHEGTAVEAEDDDEEVKNVVEHDGWSSLGWSFLSSAGLTLFAFFFPVTFAVPIFGTYLAKNWLWTFTPSLSYVGQGIIMGFPTTASMNLGMLVGWGVLSPISKTYGWAPGAVGDMATGARGWILWTALAIMCADALISLVPVMVELVRKMVHGANPDEDSNENETSDRLVSTKWVLWGLGLSIVLGTVLVWLVFGHEGIKPWATVIGFMMGTLLSILGVRALGETDLNPVSGLGKISQLLFAVIQPGNVVANIIAGGVAEAGAQQAGDLMQDLKTGHLVHASPRAQFYGQLVGSTLSIFVTVTAYNLYARAYPIPGPTFPAPTAYVWLSLARLLRNGQLPEKSGEFMLGAAIIFGALSALKTRLARRESRWAHLLPSGVAFAIGFLNTPSFSLARLIGGVVELVYHRHFAHEKHGQDIRLIVVASGFVLGEGVMSVLNLVLRTAGVGVASCWGCGHGLCGGCSA